VSTAYPELEDRDWLAHQFLVLNRTAVDIAARLGCTHSYVAAQLRRHGLRDQKRGRGKVWHGGKPLQPRNRIHGQYRDAAIEAHAEALAQRAGGGVDSTVRVRHIAPWALKDPPA
jgi:hypothetical protein